MGQPYYECVDYKWGTGTIKRKKIGIFTTRVRSFKNAKSEQTFSTTITFLT